MFPNLDGIDTISLDVETRDDHLKELGPSPRRDGYILGVGIATNDKSFYFSLEHPQSKNINKESFYTWLKTLESKTIIGANLLFDLDYLQYQGFKPQKTIDVQLAEALIDENRLRYNLDSLSLQYLGKQKFETEIDKFYEQYKNNTWKGGTKGNLWRMPANIVGPYCEEDAKLAYQIYEKQKVILAEQNLIDLFKMECKLIPFLIKMRYIGVKIDEDKLAQLQIKYKNKIEQLQKEVDYLAGFQVNVNSNRDLQKAYDKFGYKYPFTEPSKTYPNGQPSFGGDFLETAEDPLSKKILAVRNYRTIDSKFVQGLSKFIINGRIHCLFHPLKGDDKGTVTGRLSASLPNLEQIPGDANEEAKNDIRGLFLPENGEEFLKGDYSQIEMRVFAHYARGPKSDEVRDIYIKNPKADIYVDFTKIALSKKEVTKQERKIYKQITLAVLYGMGLNLLCKKLNLSVEEGKRLIYAYYNKIPSIRQTTKDASDVATRRGYVRTILGRRRRFPDAKYTYKAFNSIDQGSSADLLKSSIINANDAGIFDVLTPLNIVHDEIDCSKPCTKEGLEATKELKYIFENSIKFKVPIIFELEKGSSWANLEKFDV